MNKKSQTDRDHEQTRLVLVIGVYDREDKATRAVEKLIEQDFPADRWVGADSVVEIPIAH